MPQKGRIKKKKKRVGFSHASSWWAAVARLLFGAVAAVARRMPERRRGDRTAAAIAIFVGKGWVFSLDRFEDKNGIIKRFNFKDLNWVN